MTEDEIVRNIVKVVLLAMQRNLMEFFINMWRMYLYFFEKWICSRLKRKEQTITSIRKKSFQSKNNGQLMKGETRNVNKNRSYDSKTSFPKRCDDQYTSTNQVYKDEIMNACIMAEPVGRRKGLVAKEDITEERKTKLLKGVQG